MAFRDFTFPQVREDLGLHFRDENLFRDTPLFPVRDDFLAFIQDGVFQAVANATEKARSEFIIAPILLELRRRTGLFTFFSGLEWTVDAERGLNGFCDFILAKSESSYVMTAPFVAIVEAKNDNITNGLGQCIAAMYAAQLSNEQSKTPILPVHGVVSTGTSWKFLRIRGIEVTFDLPEYYIDNLPKIMGILHHIVQSV